MIKIARKVADYFLTKSGINDLKSRMLNQEIGRKKLLEEFNIIRGRLDIIRERLERQISTMRKIMLRNESCRPVEMMPSPCPCISSSAITGYSIGYSLNLLNNAYSFCKVARKNGQDARLFLDPNFADTFVTSLPQWEEVYFEGTEMPKNADALPAWETPEFVKSAKWDLGNLAGISCCFEYEKMRELFKDTPVKIASNDELSYLMAYTALPHLDLLKLYNSVDLLHVSGSHVGTASFTEKPYVTFPFGGDLFIQPFQDNELGCIQARGFRKASRHILSGNIMLPYMKALGIPQQRIDMVPLMIDTDIYAPRPENPLREELRQRYPGKIIFMLGARQNWTWKGNDKLWKGIARAKRRAGNAVFLTVWYGQDIEASRELIKSLGIEDVVVSIGVLSKEALRRYIDAADVCIDQFTHGGLGTFALESMSIAKPLVTYYRADKHFNFEKEPPLFSAFSEDEIAEAILCCAKKPGDLPEMGSKHREWIKRYHGHEALWPEYDAVYRKALMESKESR